MTQKEIRNIFTMSVSKAKSPFSASFCLVYACFLLQKY